MGVSVPPTSRTQLLANRMLYRLKESIGLHLANENDWKRLYEGLIRYEQVEVQQNWEEGYDYCNDEDINDNEQKAEQSNDTTILTMGSITVPNQDIWFSTTKTPSNKEKQHEDDQVGKPQVQLVITPSSPESEAMDQSPQDSDTFDTGISTTSSGYEKTTSIHWMWSQQQPISLSDSSSSLTTNTCCIITILSDSGRVVVLPEKSCRAASTTKPAIQFQGIQITVEETLDDADYYFVTLHESKHHSSSVSKPGLDPGRMFKTTQFFCKIHSMTMANQLVVQDLKFKGCFTVPQTDDDKAEQPVPMEIFQLDDFDTSCPYVRETTELANIRTFYMFLANLLYVLDPIKIVDCFNNGTTTSTTASIATTTGSDTSNSNSHNNSKPTTVFGSIGDLIRYFVTTMEDLQQQQQHAGTHRDRDDQDDNASASTPTSTDPKPSTSKCDHFYIFKRKTRNSIKTILTTVDSTFKTLWENQQESKDGARTTEAMVKPSSPPSAGTE